MKNFGLMLILMFILFVATLFGIRYWCKIIKEEKIANKVVEELAQNLDNIPNVSDKEVKEAFESGRVYMANIRMENFVYYPYSHIYSGVPLYYPPSFRSGYPYGGYPMYLYTDLYDWRPIGDEGAWFKPSSSFYKKRRYWKKGAWKENNGEYYYITY